MPKASFRASSVTATVMAMGGAFALLRGYLPFGEHPHVGDLVTALLLGSLTAWVMRRMRRLEANEAGLLARAKLHEAILENVADAVVAVDVQRKAVVLNAAARRLFPHASVGNVFSKGGRLAKEDGAPTMWSKGCLGRALAGEETQGAPLMVTSGLTRPLTRPGRPESTGAWVSPSGRPLRDSSGCVTGAVCIYRDVSVLRQKTEHLTSLSITDELTGLYNRRGFMLLAEQHLRLASRTKTTFAVIFADLNGLKTINDTLGHEAGDRAIRSAGRVLRRTLRESDILARLGGDEFVALVSIPSESAVGAVVRRIEIALAEENAKGPLFELSLSLGEAMFDPSSQRSLHDLISEADELMYARKVESRRTTGAVLRIARSA
jgi:diguanylate cyclase (GGDEF)-like protein